jgi:hypothetical protein
MGPGERQTVLMGFLDQPSIGLRAKLCEDGEASTILVQRDLFLVRMHAQS